jgi:hypothetical protein
MTDLAPNITRLLDLVGRLVGPGPKAAHVSASECHEIREGVLDLAGALEDALQDRGFARAAQARAEASNRSACDGLMAQMARTDGVLKELDMARLVVHVARLVNRGPYEDERMTGILAAYDALAARSREE